jgi:hypothetical protein
MIDHNEIYKKQIREAIRRHGSLFTIPSSERDVIMERHRAWEVVAKVGGVLDAGAMRDHGIPASIVKEICGSTEAPLAKKVTRAQKRKNLEKWCDEHVGVTVTPQTISEIADFSYSTALSYIAERPDLFSKVKRGYYLIRDPRSERQAVNGN